MNNYRTIKDDNWEKKIHRSVQRRHSQDTPSKSGYSCGTWKAIIGKRKNKYFADYVKHRMTQKNMCFNVEDMGQSIQEWTE